MVVKKFLLVICLGCLVMASFPAGSAFPVYGDAISPPLYNKIETTSTMNLKIASITTALGDQFISGSANGVELYNNVQVSSYTEGIPSKGSVSAFIKGSTIEGGSSTGLGPLTSSDLMSGKCDLIDTLDTTYQKPEGPWQVMSFFDFTSMDGEITSFSKFMSYRSSLL